MSLPPSYLTIQQRKVVELPVTTKIFLSGPAGTGKTTTGVERLLFLLETGIPGNQILILVPQRTLATPYYEILNSSGTPAGSSVSIMTIAGLARRMIDLFWPIISMEAGFKYPNLPPNFLTLETAQYYMAKIVRPYFNDGFFDSVTLDRNRLYSQILDNLNKAAVNNFSYTEIGERLKSAWVGDPGQVHIYEDVQICASEYRQYCLDNNLLDFSLQIEIFSNMVWNIPICRQYLHKSYKHLIYDNIEEDTYVTATILIDWIPNFVSSLLIFDNNAGYRRFLGADPESAESLSNLCENLIEFNQGFVSSQSMVKLESALESVLSHSRQIISRKREQTSKKSDFFFESDGVSICSPQPAIRFYPDMLDWVAEQISILVENGTPPGKIVVLSPYLSDALRFTLVDRLDRFGIPSHSHRPSRPLRDESASRCLLTLTKLAHPNWDLIPTDSDVTYALVQAVGDMDLIRAQLLTKIIYRKGQLFPFEDIKQQVQERITYLLGEYYDRLRLWITDYLNGNTLELDHFLARLFGEVLSQPGFGFHANYNAGGIVASLVESVQKFRWVAGDTLYREGIQVGKEYLEMVESGVIASQYLTPWQFTPEDSVFLSPAYTFLMSNRPVDYQFWLNVGSRGWYERLYQPLTHPYVLSHRWAIGRPWTDIEEAEASRDTLLRLSLGLIRRCRRVIFLGISELSEQGYDNKGKFLRVLDKAMRIL